MEPKTHAELIANLVARGRGSVQTKEFHKNFFPALVADEPDGGWSEGLDMEWLRMVFPFLPDAFKIDEQHKMLTLYEVEVSYQVPHRKLETMSSAAFHFYVVGWDTTIVLVDRYGRRRIEPWYPILQNLIRKHSKPKRRYVAQ